MADSEFYRTLQDLGLEQYHAALVAEAFDSWPVLARITEQDMNTLNIRLGHRRILQDAIAKFSNNNALQQAQRSGLPFDALPQLSLPLPPLQAQDAGSMHMHSGVRQKRKYVRHPKTDENAPQRPPTGYVLFSNHVRDGIKDKNYDFPDIAKLVGKRWQTASQQEKDHFLNEAKRKKAIYVQEMTKYKRTARYREYQRYLLDFKIRNGSLPPARAHSRLRGGEDSMDEEVGSPRSDAHFIGNVSDMSDYGSNEMSRARFRRDASNGSEQSRSPSSVIRSPSTIEPTMGTISYSMSSRPNSGPRSPLMRTSQDTIANRLPSLSGLQSSRQLPPLHIPPLRH